MRLKLAWPSSLGFAPAGRGRRRGGRHWAAIAVACLIAAVALAPLLALGVQLLASGAPAAAGSWRSLMRLTLNTLALTASAAALATIIGAGTAWLVARYEFPGRRLAGLALFMPFAIPPYLAAYVWADLAERIGRGMHMRSMAGAAAVMALVLYPYVYLLARTAFAQQVGALMAAARILGCSPRQAFWRVAVPLARPAIAVGALLAAMEAANDIAIAEDYGIATLGYYVYDAWLNRGDKASAVLASGVLAGLALLAASCEAASRRSQRHHQEQARTYASEAPRRLNGWRSAAAATACWLPFVLGFAAPAAALVRHGLYAPAGAWSTLPASLLGTAILIGGAVALAYAFAAAFAAAAARTARLAQVLDRITRSGYAVPGSVYALGALLAAAALADAAEITSGLSIRWLWTAAPVLLIGALATRYLAVAAGAVEAGRAAVPPRLAAAARSSGLSGLQVLRRAKFPLMAPALTAGILLMGTDIIKELPLTLILRPLGLTSLAVETYGFAADEDLLGAAPPALAMVSLAAAGLALAYGRLTPAWTGPANRIRAN